MEINFLEKRKANRSKYRALNNPWIEGANVAFYMDYDQAVLFIKDILGIKDGWPLADAKDKTIKGWTFMERVIDKVPEEISYRHLLSFPDEQVVFYFHIKNVGCHYMLQIAQALRDYIELAL